MTNQTEIVARRGEFYIPAQVYEAIVASHARIAPLADREAIVMALGEQGGIWPSYILPDVLDLELRERFDLLPG